MAYTTRLVLLTICLSSHGILASPVHDLNHMAREVFSTNETTFPQEEFSLIEAEFSEHHNSLNEIIFPEEEVSLNETEFTDVNTHPNETEFTTHTDSLNETASKREAVRLVTRCTAGEHYGVLLDTGSTSTKLKIYKYTKPSNGRGIPNVTPVKIEKDSKKYKPGLADVEGGLPGIKTYLLKILEAAKRYVPAEKHSESPVFVLATAGFRLLGVDGARDGMEDVEEILMDHLLHPFKYTPGSASVLSGEEEGAYAWLAANYLNGFFYGNKPESDSVGVLEMGGGSTQIAFIPRDPLMAEEFQVIMAGKRYSLYVQSYLEFGLNAIRRRLEEELVSGSPGQATVNQPCMLHGDTNTFTSGNRTVTFQGTGQVSECQALYDNLVASAPAEDCYLEPCAIGSVFQPSVKGIEFYAISAYAYSLKAVGAVRDDHSLDLNSLWNNAKNYCEQDISEISAGARDFASANCMQAIYCNELFTKPYGFPKSSRHIKVTSEINGVDIDWALGAMLEFLSLSFLGISSPVSVHRK